MSSARYDVVMEDRIVDGFDIDDVKKSVAQLFKVDVTTVNKLFQQRPVVIKKSVPRAAAEKYFVNLSRIGVCCKINEKTPPATIIPLLDNSAPYADTSAKPNLSLEKGYSNDSAKQKSQLVDNQKNSLTESLAKLKPAPEKPPAGVSMATRLDQLALIPTEEELALEQKSEQEKLAMQTVDAATTAPANSAFQCPKCQTEQVKTEQCQQCGVIFSKLAQRRPLSLEPASNTTPTPTVSPALSPPSPPHNNDDAEAVEEPASSPIRTTTSSGNTWEGFEQTAGPIIVGLLYLYVLMAYFHIPGLSDWYLQKTQLPMIVKEMTLLCAGDLQCEAVMEEKGANCLMEARIFQEVQLSQMESFTEELIVNLETCLVNDDGETVLWQLIDEAETMDDTTGDWP